MLIAKTPCGRTRGRRSNNNVQNMAENIGLKLQEILSKLNKLDSIEVAVKNIEANLKNLEK